MQDSISRRNVLTIAASGAASHALAQTPVGERNSGRTTRIGVVGGGFGTSFQWHLHPKCKVTAVCDIRPDRLQRLSEVYKCGNTYNNFRQMLKHPELDAVAVFTPAPLHAWMDIEALKAGKHVISAVPAAMSVEELEQLLDTVKTTGLKYMMAETSFYRPAIITSRQWANEGKFGTIF
jgi:predicted dehydrogenase